MKLRELIQLPRPHFILRDINEYTRGIWFAEVPDRPFKPEEPGMLNCWPILLQHDKKTWYGHHDGSLDGEPIDLDEEVIPWHLDLPRVENRDPLLFSTGDGPLLNWWALSRAEQAFMVLCGVDFGGNMAPLYIFTHPENGQTSSLVPQQVAMYLLDPSWTLHSITFE